ncbi:MAG: hypothetical protein ACKV2V_11950 [Blastocatellia bacterium]
MEKIHSVRFVMLKRVHDFGAKYQGDFAPGSHALELFAELNEVIGQILKNDTTQSTERKLAKQSTASRTQARNRLREMMQLMHNTARGMALRRRETEIRFEMPPKGNDAALLTAAHSFHAMARLLADEFIQREMSADFLAELASLITAFENTTTTRNESRTSHIVANNDIGEDIAEGMRVVGQIDPVIRNRYKGNKQMLLIWQVVSRVSRSGRPVVMGQGAGEGETPTPETVVEMPAPQGE